MTQNTEQQRENCTACNGTRSGSTGRVFTCPESEDKKNTSTEQLSLAERREALDALDALALQAQELGMGYE